MSHEKYRLLRKPIYFTLQFNMPSPFGYLKFWKYVLHIFYKCVMCKLVYWVCLKFNPLCHNTLSKRSELVLKSGCKNKQYITKGHSITDRLAWNCLTWCHRNNLHFVYIMPWQLYNFIFAQNKSTLFQRDTYFNF